MIRHSGTLPHSALSRRGARGFGGRCTRFDRRHVAASGAAIIRLGTICPHAAVPGGAGARTTGANPAAIRQEAETSCIEAAFPATGAARSETRACTPAPLPLRFNRADRHRGRRHTDRGARHRRKKGGAYSRARWQSISGRLYPPPRTGGPNTRLTNVERRPHSDAKETSRHQKTEGASRACRGPEDGRRDWLERTAAATSEARRQGPWQQDCRRPACREPRLTVSSRRVPLRFSRRPGGRPSPAICRCRMRWFCALSNVRERFANQSGCDAEARCDDCVEHRLECR